MILPRTDEQTNKNVRQLVAILAMIVYNAMDTSSDFTIMGGIEMSNAQGCQCGQAHAACTNEFQYAVKTICGEANTETPNAPVAPGQYWTAINIHNPDKCKNANFRVKVAIALEKLPSPISVYYPVNSAIALGPDGAFEIDCPLIRLIVQILYSPQSPPQFIKGYFVIESDIELDVVAVYTAAQSIKGPVSTFQTERVQGRCVPVCEDLVLPLNTGVAAWQTINSSGTLVGPVVAPLPLSSFTTGAWGPAPFGSSWASAVASDGTNAPAETQYYQLCFDLCSGFTAPAQIQIQVAADNSAQVLLNNISVGNVTGFAPPTLVTITPSANPLLLQAGRNCLQVNVTNNRGTTPNPTGFYVAGILQVARGKCPCAPLPLAAPPQGQGADAKEAASLFDQIANASKAN
jgi:hypothetical protein